MRLTPMAQSLRKARTKEPVTTMIDSLSVLSLPPPKRGVAAETGDAPAFSYAFASAALEAQASASLKTFGATAGADISAAPASNARLAATGETTAPRTAATPDSNPVRAEAETAPRPRAAPAADASTLQPASIGAAATTTGAAPTVAIVAAHAMQPLGLPTRAEGTARDALAQRAVSDAARLKAPARAAAAGVDFARLLARKLEDGATAFKLRLDPPTLGRVAARLTVGEDGRAQLALSFDNQAAHDLFRRDEAGLRVLLAAAGFDLGANDLAFSFAPQDQAPAASPALFADAVADAVANAQFSADWSRGLVDLTA